MDLALHLGGTADALARSMTEGELRHWDAYTARRPLPFRRLELYLAQIALVVARSMGGSHDYKLADFLLFEEADKPDDTPASAEDARAFFGFSPRRKD